MQNCTRSKIAGAIAGMVLGDALGVPGELWPREKVRERFGWIDTFLDGPEDNIVACYFKAAHYTDDSAQAFVVLKALLEYKAVPPVKELAKRLIDWVISMNGFEINLLGPSSKASLLAHSEGRDPSQYLKTALTNGAAMRIAPVDCLIDADKPELLAKTVADISKVPHGTDVAIAGAAMVAQAVASGIAGRSWDESADDVLAIFDIAKTYGESTWAASVKRRFELALDAACNIHDPEEYSRWIYEVLGTGTMTSESVSAALAVAWFCRDAKKAAIMCANMGGDTDTMGAMAVAICGAMNGIESIPADWLKTLEETNNLNFLELADQIIETRPAFNKD